MEITPGMVMGLRKKTGLPMMECKKALEEAAGDEAKALEILRKKGLAQVGKRAERTTSEGRVICQVDQDSGRVALVEVLCETAPVVDTDDFRKLAKAAGQVAIQLETPTAEAILGQPMPGEPGRKVQDFLHDVVNRIRENIRIGRVVRLSGHIGQYVHHDGKKGVLVEFSGPCPPNVMADVCMHVAAMRPLCTRREEVDPKLVEQERQVAAEQVKGKPANMIEKIMTGKLNRWYSEIVLLEQPFVKEEKKSVGQILREVSPELTIKRIVRFEIGEA